MAPLLPPDHKPLASPLDDMKITVPGALTLSVTVHGMCPATVQAIQSNLAIQPTPVVRQADDPPREDHSAPPSYLRDLGAQSTSGAPIPFNNSNWPVLQRRSSNAHLMMSSTNAALLFGDTPATPLDWLPTYPSSVVR